MNYHHSVMLNFWSIVWSNAWLWIRTLCWLSEGRRSKSLGGQEISLLGP